MIYRGERVADEQFLERCGENLIPVDYAKSITESVKAKNIRRRTAQRDSGDESHDASASSSVDAGATIDDTGDIKSTLADSTRTALENAEAEVMGEEPASLTEPKGFTIDEVDHIVKKGKGKSVIGEMALDIHTIGGQRFIKLKDLLPPTPPRGEFDVEKTRTSQYFFS